MVRFIRLFGSILITKMIKRQVKMICLPMKNDLFTYEKKTLSEMRVHIDIEIVILRYFSSLEIHLDLTDF